MTLFLIADVLKNNSELSEMLNFNMKTYEDISVAFAGGEITQNSDLSTLMQFMTNVDKSKLQTFLDNYGIDTKKIQVMIEEDMAKAQEIYNTKEAVVLGYISDIMFGKQVAKDLPPEYLKKRENNQTKIQDINQEGPELSR